MNYNRYHWPHVYTQCCLQGVFKESRFKITLHGKKNWEHSVKERALSTSQLQTSLGENSPTVSINTGWGFLGLSEGFGVNKQTFKWIIQIMNMRPDVMSSVFLPSWERTHQLSHHLLASQHPFLPARPPWGWCQTQFSAMLLHFGLKYPYMSCVTMLLLSGYASLVFSTC